MRAVRLSSVLVGIMMLSLSRAAIARRASCAFMATTTGTGKNVASTSARRTNFISTTPRFMSTGEATEKTEEEKAAIKAAREARK
jgi:hypothetical protein